MTGRQRGRSGVYLSPRLTVARPALAQQIPNPVDFQRSRWAADPFALGAYPHVPPGATPADLDVMAQPVPYAANLPGTANRLFFAGDGTHRQHPSSVWGAYETGRREALRIQPQLR